MEELSQDLFCHDLLRESHQILCCGSNISSLAVLCTMLLKNGKPGKVVSLMTVPYMFFLGVK